MLLVGGALLLAGISVSVNEPAAAQGPIVDHSAFPMLAGPFETGQEVTAACLICHPDAAASMRDTIHWTWEWDNPATGQTVGKVNVMNNYCVSVNTNEPRCTSCHVGYGWRDDSFDFEEDTNVDCLVCHDTTATYRKFPTAAGHPPYEPMVFGGTEWPAVDLASVAQNVGPTSRQTCGACHFYGGGGAGVKHGDLDPSLVDPPAELDVHMASDGLNFTCTACHTSENHHIDGSRYEMGIMDSEIDGLATCVSCHEPPHAESELVWVLDLHTDRVACQSCHIPTYARELPTKIWWDWSSAGQMNEEGKPFVLTNEAGEVIYDSKKGDFVWETDVVPEYTWFNGAVFYTLPDTLIDDTGVWLINPLSGSRADENARIWPVKAFRGIQPYDSRYRYLASLHLFPSGPDDTTAYWKGWDWDRAIEAGLAGQGLPYSGEYDWIETEMLWPLSHMVAPAEQALTCGYCHSPEGRLDWVALGYSEEEAVRLGSMSPPP